MSENVKCQYCDKEYKAKGIHVHEAQCKENPDNKVVDKSVMKDTEKSNETEPAIRVMTEGQLRKQAESMKKRIMADEYVDILVVPTDAYPEGTKRMIGLNGVNFSVPVGIHFPKGVPKCIADVYYDSHKRTKEAQNKAKAQLTGEIKVV